MPIFDQGYQHWQGELSGHGWRWWAIVRHGVRVQMKNRLLRILVLIAWVVPAGLLVAAVAVWGLVEQQTEGAMALLSFLPADILRNPKAYRSMFWTLAYSNFFSVQMVFIMLVVVIAGPGLISRDLRFNALPLYFSRPLTRLDYFLGKLGVIGVLVGAVAVVPAVIAYAVGVAFSRDLAVVGDTYPVLLASVAYGLVITLSVGTSILALSSLTRRSLFVGITWAGIWLISGAVSFVLDKIYIEVGRREAVDAELGRWLADHPPPPGVQMHGPHLVFRQPKHDPDGRPVPPDPAVQRWEQEYFAAARRAHANPDIGGTAALRRNWRPLTSYLANLERLADALLDTDAAWVKYGEAMSGVRGLPFGGPPPSPAEAGRKEANEHVHQYPWWWSAALLSVLMGISAWTLTRRVKSLDRLK